LDELFELGIEPATLPDILTDFGVFAFLGDGENILLPDVRST
jgi:hypothetical protein